MSDAVGSDPRVGASRQDDIRPTVARAPGNLSLWLFGAGLAIVAILLFGALNANRLAREAPATKARRSDATLLPASPPPLFVPPAPLPPPVIAQPLPQPIPSPPEPAPRLVEPPAPPPMIASPPIVMAPPADERPAAPPSSAVVLDTSQGPPPVAAPAAPGAAAPGQPPAFAVRPSAQAGQLRRKATTVPQGTLIPAVLETALDSTRPGQARALVSKDVRGFDGSRVLIPRGSQLFGEYRADLQPGQNRALVQWTRLVRPDGVTIAIDSPAADALGRAGIRGRVNSHFFERFGAAILQSSLDLGVNLAARSIGDGTYVYIPNASIGSAASPLQPRQVQPTLKVRQGVQVSVFVARDLDFSTVDTRP